MELLVILIIIAAIITFYMPVIKGKIGEQKVSLILSMLDKNKYSLINDIMLKVGDKTSQIDHVIVSNYGVFVIETKNYKGWIFGDERSQYWTQQIYKRKEKLYNPIHQNYGHVQVLKQYLIDYPNILYIPIVVFSTKADLKINVTSEVVYTVGLLKTIKKYNNEILSDPERLDITSRIISMNINNSEERKNHVAMIRQKKSNTYNKISNNICPKCGGELVVRKGKYGNFKGCSNYPKCKFTLNS